MIPLALFLLAAATHVDLVDDVFQIPAGEWRYVDELSLHQKPAFVSADFEVRSGSRHVRLELMRREDLERLRKSRPYGVLEATKPPSVSLYFSRSRVFRRGGCCAASAAERFKRSKPINDII